MAVLAIDINDAGLVVANDSAVLAVEPGFARIERGKIVTGEAAKAGARLSPRQTSNRFWSGLSLEPGSAGSDLGKSAAELAYAQLESLWTQVSGAASPTSCSSYRARTARISWACCSGSRRNAACRFALSSIRRLPRAFGLTPSRQLMYVDAGLHKASVTLIDQDGEAQVRVEHALNQGLAALADAFARRIADLFVRATRFDPRTHAETEQLLYDRLPQWLEALQRDERVELTLKYRDEEFRVAAERDAVFGVAHGFNRALTQLIAQHRERGQERRRSGVGAVGCAAGVRRRARAARRRAGGEIHDRPCCAQRAARARASSRPRRRRKCGS